MLSDQVSCSSLLDTDGDGLEVEEECLLSHKFVVLVKEALQVLIQD